MCGFDCLAAQRRLQLLVRRLALLYLGRFSRLSLRVRHLYLLELLIHLRHECRFHMLRNLCQRTPRMLEVHIAVRRLHQCSQPLRGIRTLLDRRSPLRVQFECAGPLQPVSLLCELLEHLRRRRVTQLDQKLLKDSLLDGVVTQRRTCLVVRRLAHQPVFLAGLLVLADLQRHSLVHGGGGVLLLRLHLARPASQLPSPQKQHVCLDTGLVDMRLRRERGELAADLTQPSIGPLSPSQLLLLRHQLPLPHRLFRLAR